jgi:hypothetical protein
MLRCFGINCLTCFSGHRHEFLEQWLITKKSSVRPTTAYQYSLMVYREIIPILGHIKMKDLSPGPYPDAV